MKVTLKAARVNKGLTQIAAAEQLHVAPKTLICWEKGVTFPNTKQLMELCDLYGCNVWDIFLPNELG